MFSNAVNAPAYSQSVRDYLITTAGTLGRGMNLPPHVIADGPRKTIHGWDGPALRCAPVIGHREFDKLVNSAHQHDTPPPLSHERGRKLEMGMRREEFEKLCG